MDNLNSIPNVHQNGFLLFVLGILFILSVYHFLLFFQQKDKSYLYYSAYTFTLVISYIIYPENSFLNMIPNTLKNPLTLTHHFWVCLYNIIYFTFVLRFLSFKKYFPKQNKIINYCLYSLLTIAVITFLITLILNNSFVLDWYYNNIFIQVIIILTLWGFYLVAMVKEQTKYYILSGSFFLFISSILAILIIDYKVILDNDSLGFFIFYFGIIFENLCFSLALGLKQKLIAQEKSNTQKNFIKKLKENRELKEIVNKQLQQKIKVLDKQIELQNEIENLKLTALKSQMKPHFIFNALNSIKLYINKNDTDNANYYLDSFAKLIRKILEVSSFDFISLEEELEITNLYIDIENTRLKTPVTTTISIDEHISLKRTKVPSLLFQPFVENAIWHGLATIEKKKIIDINISTNTNEITITITDNGIGRQASLKKQQEKVIHKKSIGIQLVKNKLETLYDKNNLINIIDLYDKNNLPKGTSVIIKLSRPKIAIQ